MAELKGIPLEQSRAEAEEEARLTKLGRKYKKRPPSEWPPLRFEWDLASGSQHFVYDGMSEEEFSEKHPDGLISGQVNVVEFDAVLCRHNKRRDLKELWKYGDDSKLCYAIAYLEAGLPMTPGLWSQYTTTSCTSLAETTGTQRQNVAGKSM